jgi:plasmid stability protein
MKASEHPKLILRTPPDLREWLKDRAERHGWSVTSEFIQILRAAKQAEQRDAA